MAGTSGGSSHSKHPVASSPLPGSGSREVVTRPVPTPEGVPVLSYLVGQSHRIFSPPNVRAPCPKRAGRWGRATTHPAQSNIPASVPHVPPHCLAPGTLSRHFLMLSLHAAGAEVTPPDRRVHVRRPPDQAGAPKQTRPLGAPAPPVGPLPSAEQSSRVAESSHPQRWPRQQRWGRPEWGGGRGGGPRTVCVQHRLGWQCG